MTFCKECEKPVGSIMVTMKEWRELLRDPSFTCGGRYYVRAHPKQKKDRGRNKLAAKSRVKNRKK